MLTAKYIQELIEERFLEIKTEHGDIALDFYRQGFIAAVGLYATLQKVYQEAQLMDLNESFSSYNHDTGGIN